MFARARRKSRVLKRLLYLLSLLLEYITQSECEKREKTKKEMFKQLRSLGDMVLGNFGLSCDNFKAEKDENTGGFSLKFVQEKAGETKTRVINENESNNNNSAAAAATASK